MKSSDFTRVIYATLALAGLAMTGCLNLSPTADPTRYFVLSPLPASDTPAPEKTTMLGLGLATIELPTYLHQSALAIRRSETEIGYADYTVWAERLDKGLQRVLASNLSALLPGLPIKLSLWDRAEVDWELRVRIHRFEFDAQGLATVDASWSVHQPGAKTPPHTGHFQQTRQGPNPANDPAGAVEGLSSLLGECSRAIAEELRTLAKR